jgi:hypothetical protein
MVRDHSTLGSFPSGRSCGDSTLSPKKQHGKEGIMVKEMLKNGNKVKVKLDNDLLEFITVDPKYLEGVTTTYAVHRMHVRGGGIIKEGNSDTLISLEWVDAASPFLDLDEGILRAVCPTCRAVEPLHKAYDDDADDSLFVNNKNNTSVPLVWKLPPPVVFWNAITPFDMSVGISGEILLPTCFLVAPSELSQDELQRTRDYN